MIKRRSFIVGLAATAIAVPSLVRATVLMPVKKLATVCASHQSGHSLIINPLTQPLAAGDIITIDGVDSLDRQGEPSAALRTFIITARAEIGHRVVHIYPPIDGHGRYRTVVNLPKNGAELKRFSI